MDWRSIANRPRALYDVTLNGDSLAVIASVTAVCTCADVRGGCCCMMQHNRTTASSELRTDQPLRYQTRTFFICIQPIANKKFET